MALAPPVVAGRNTTPKARRRAARNADHGRRSGWGPIFAAPHAAGLLIFTAVPIVMSIVLGFYEWPMLGEPTFNGIQNFVKLLTDDTFQSAIANTFVFVILYVILNLIVSLGLAAWLGPEVRFRQFFRVLFFIPAVTPIVANVVVWRLLYQPEGLINQILARFGVTGPDYLNDPSWALFAMVIMSVWQGFGYNMLVFSSALDSVPTNQIEAARLDGANSWRIFWNVRFPLITPSIFFATTLTIITSFQVFVQPFILTKGGPGDSTMTIVLYLYNQGFAFQNLGLAAAAASILFVIILIVTALQFLGEKKWVHYE